MNHNKMKIISNRGFTLMEVLVALAVLSIGLLGMAGMQLFSLTSNYDAYLRTQATYFAYDLIDKVRANRAETLTGGYDSALSSIPGSFTNCQLPSANCSTTQLATFELTQWKCGLGAYAGNAACVAPLNLTTILPSGDGSVTRAGNDITVTVQWIDRGTTETISVLAEL